MLMLCSQAGLVKLGHVALDGNKVRANASEDKAMSYKQMKEKEAQLAAEVAEMLRQAQEVDDEEDRRYGRDKRGDELPEDEAQRNFTDPEPRIMPGPGVRDFLKAYNYPAVVDSEHQ